MQIDYTSRDYESLKADLITLVNKRTGLQWEADNPSDLGSVLLEAFAYMGDVMSYYLDRVANELSVDTAVKRSTLLSFANLYGYKPSGPTPAQVSITFTNNGVSSIDLPIGTQVMAPLTYGNYTEAYFETTQAIIQLQAGQSITVPAREGKTANTDRPDLISPTTYKPLPVSLGTSSGAANQEFLVFDTGIVDNTMVVYVGQGDAFSSWKYVESFIDAKPEELVFTTSLNEDGTTTIIFGDGINGGIPAANQLISALYKTSIGVYGNVVAGAIEEITFVPGNGDLEQISYISATNPSAAYGGADSDSNTQLRAKIKGAISSKQRAVTLDDYSYLTNQVPTVGKSKAVAGTPTSITIYVQSQDDSSVTPGISSGLPTSSWNTLQTNVVSYLSDKKPAGTTVTVTYPTYVPLYLRINIIYDDAYKRSAVKLAISKALLNAGGLFSYDKNTFGRVIPTSTVTSTIASIPGVVSVDLVKFNTTNASTYGTITLANNEIPYLLPENLTYNTETGGIA